MFGFIQQKYIWSTLKTAYIYIFCRYLNTHTHIQKNIYVKAKDIRYNHHWIYWCTLISLLEFIIRVIKFCNTKMEFQIIIDRFDSHFDTKFEWYSQKKTPIHLQFLLFTIKPNKKKYFHILLIREFRLLLL